MKGLGTSGQGAGRILFTPRLYQLLNEKSRTWDAQMFVHALQAAPLRHQQIRCGLRQICPEKGLLCSARANALSRVQCPVHHETLSHWLPLRTPPLCWAARLLDTGSGSFQGTPLISLQLLMAYGNACQ